MSYIFHRAGRSSKRGSWNPLRRQSEDLSFHICTGTDEFQGQIRQMTGLKPHCCSWLRIYKSLQEAMSSSPPFGASPVVKPLDKHPNTSRLGSHEHRPAWALSKNANTNWQEAGVASHHLWRNKPWEAGQRTLLTSQKSPEGGQEALVPGFPNMRHYWAKGFLSFLREWAA